MFKLDFRTESGGDCERKTYEDAQLDDVDKGTFTLSDDDGGGLAAGDDNRRGNNDE